MLETPILAEMVMFDAWRWIVAAWVFAVGACIGSFLNVVIYRLPAGLSIAHPPSRCPACKKNIRAYDNIPILSWLVLRGRCRNCGARFSARYAWVEFISGALLLAVAVTGPAMRYENLQAMLDAPAFWPRWGEVACLATLLAGLWSAAMIAHDGHRPPWKLIITPLVVGVVASMLWFRPSYEFCSPVQIDIAALRVISPWLGIGGFIVSTAAAAVAQVCTFSGKPTTGSSTNNVPTIAAWGGMIGLYLGWQFAILAHTLTAVLYFLTSEMRKSQSAANWLMVHAVAATTIILAREPLASALASERWPSWWPAAAAAIIVALSLATRSRSGQAKTDQPL